MGKGASKEASAEDIPAGLDPTILQLVPEHAKEKILLKYTEYKGQYDELQASYENYRVNSEQRFFELEKNLNASNESLGIESRAVHELRQTVTKLEEKLKESTAQLEDIQIKKNESDVILRELESARCNLEIEKSDLTQALDRKNNEIDRLNEEWKEMSERLNKANEERIGALVKKDEMETQMNSSIHREQRLVQENSQLQQQKDWLDQELKTKIDELLNIRKDQAGRCLEMEAQLEQRGEEVIHLEELVGSLKDNIQEMTARTDQLYEQIKEGKDRQMQMEEQHRTQIRSQNKLTELYKDSAEDAESQVKELTSAVSELQKLLKEASSAYTELEKQKEGDISKLLETIKDRDDDINRMNEELKNANDLLEVAKAKGQMRMTEDAIEAMSPSAAAASRLLKSGMTLTQIYSEFVRVSDELQNEKLENERLSQNLDKILEEIEQKAPVFKRQRENYEATLSVVDQLTRQLDAARVEQEKLQVESDEGKRKALHLGRENQRFRQQSVDLGQQVRMLLKELEEARGRVIPADVEMDEHNLSSDEVSSSSQIISEKLVTFRGIEDLQKKNQELLAALRNLSEEREDAEKQAMDARSADLKRQLEAVTDELEMMRTARDRQSSMVESVVRQRDMYRVLLAETGSAPHVPPSPQTSTPLHTQKTVPPSPEQPEPPRSASPTYEKKMLEEKSKALKELMEEFNQYREQRRQNEKMLTEQIETLRQQASDAKVQNAKLASQLDYSGERIKVFKNNTDSYKKEIDALRDKNQKYAAAVIRNEQTIMSIKEDLSAVRERLSRAEVVADNLRVERNMLKSVESRLLQEKENARREQNTQKILLANLQAIQNNLERSDFENKTRLNSRIEMLEKENAGLKNKLDGIDSQHRGNLNRLERQLADVQNECEQSLKYKQEAFEQLQSKEKEVETLKQKLNELQGELDKSEANRTDLTTPVPIMTSTPGIAEEEIKDLKAQINASKIEINNLKAKLEAEKSHKEQYQNIASSIETTLKEQSETNQHFKETAETQLTETREANVQLLRQLELSGKERQRLIDENFKATDNFHRTNAELQKQLKVIQSELEEAVTQRQTAIANEQDARRDLSDQAGLAQEAQDKYERELILHAADVEILTNLKKERESFASRLSTAEEEARDARAILEAAKDGWTEREKLLKGEENKLKQRVTELQEQNRVLHDELDSMGTQLVNLQQHHDQDEKEKEALADQVKSDTMSDRPAEQLMEVIRFLRKEKELALAKFDVAQAENTRIKQRLEFIEKQLEETTEALSVERQNAQVQMASAAQHMELMKKVDQLNLTTESNKLLRSERDQLSAQLRETETKAKKLEEDINPLQAANRELTSERDALVTEKTALVGEVDRWRARTNHLIEQCNKTDPEEYKRLLKERDLTRKQLVSNNDEINRMRTEIAKLTPQLARAEQERENLKKQNTTCNEEIHKLRAEVSRVNAQISKNEADLTSQKSELEKVGAERDKMKTDFAAKSQEVDEKNRTITQLRNVARKYKKEATDATAKLRAQAPNVRVTQLEEKLKKTEKELEAMTERLGSSDFEKNEASKRVKELELEAKTLQEARDKANEDMKTAKANEDALDNVNKSLQEQITKLQEEVKKNKDSETKHQQVRAMLMTAKNKIKSQIELVEKLTAEVTELKQKLDAAEKESSAQKAASESRVASLEKDLAQSQSSGASAQPESQRDKIISQLQQKITALQKQVDSQQKTPPPSGTPKPTLSAPPVERPSGPTANIRPITASSANPRQQVRNTSAVASIKPMVGAPTPTATVMPTTVSVHDEMASPSSQVRPTPPVQPVSPHIEPDTQAPIDQVEPDASEMMQPAQEPMPSTSTGRETISSSANKRLREDGEGSDAELDSAVKRPKTQEAEVIETEETVPMQESSQDSEPPQVEIEASQPESQEESTPAREIGVVEPATQTTQAPSTEAAVTSQSSTTPAEHGPVEPRSSSSEMEKHMSGGERGEIIVLDDDEEDQQPEEEDYDDEEEGEDDYQEGEEDEDENPDMERYSGDEEVVVDSEEEEVGEYDVIADEDYREGEEEEDMEEYDNDEEEAISENEGAGTQDTVVIDDDDDDEDQGDDESAANLQTQEQEQPAPTEQPSGAQVAPQVTRVQTTRFPARVERPATSRAQQLPPFMLGTNQFEEGDDSIVPSTPTLLQPKTGTDGFQVAISSPQVPQGRFLFNSVIQTDTSGTLPSQSELAQLATQEGVDDTRMDLSQFDDGTGRSVPTTPRSRTPPTIAITEAPSQEEETSSSAATSAEVPSSQVASDKPQSQETLESESASQREDEPAEEGRHEPVAEAIPSTSQESMEEGQGEAGPGDEGEAGHSNDDKPGTSGSGGEKQEPGTSRPKKIQRIVWDQPAASTGASPGQPTQRKFGRGAVRPSRGHVTPQRGGAQHQQQFFRGTAQGGSISHQMNVRGTALRSRPLRGQRSRRSRPF